MDPLTDRIRQGLAQEQWRLPADDDLLSRVHAGAARRRRRRAAAGVAASVLVLTGLAGTGAYVLDGLGGNHAVTATDEARSTDADAGGGNAADSAPETPDTMTGPDEGARGDTEDGEESRSDGSDGSSDPPENAPERTGRVPSGFRPISFLAPDRVLGTNPTDDGSTLLARAEKAGGDFEVVGKVPAPPAPRESEPTSRSVTDVRFAGSHGWAFGNALWSTHDGGATWTEITAVSGDVILLEASGGSVFAVAHEGGNYTLWRSSTGRDDWERATSLQNPHDLAVLNNYVAVPDGSPDGSDRDGSRLVVSTDGGETFDTGRNPCGEEALGPGTVSVTVEATWLACPTGTGVTVRVSDSAGVEQDWTVVRPSEPLSNTGLRIEALDASTLIMATSGEVVRLRSDGTMDSASVDGLTAPKYVEFTSSSTGYVLGSGGGLYRTTDGGSSWSPVSVR